MKLSKLISSSIYKVIFFIGIIEFLFILFSVVYLGEILPYRNIKNRFGFNFILVLSLSISIIILLMMLYHYLCSLSEELIVFIYGKVLKIIFLFHFIIILLLGAVLVSIPESFWDEGFIFQIVNEFINTGMYSGEYFINVPTNITAFFFELPVQTMIYYIIPNASPMQSTIIFMIFNCILIEISISCIIKVARQLLGYKEAILGSCICLLFIPYYFYSMLIYTDIFSLPFGIIAFYLFVKYNNSIIKKQKYIYLMVFLFLGFIGSKLKPTLFIMILAILITVILKDIKKYYKFVLTVIIFFILGACIFNLVLSSINNIFPTKPTDASHKYPYTMYILMGLSGEYGDYSSEDYNKTIELLDKYGENKTKEIERKLIVERLKSKLSRGYHKFLMNKAKWIWGDGTYLFDTEVISSDSLENESRLRDWIFSDTIFRNSVMYISQSMQLVFVIFITLGMIISIKKDINIQNLYINILLLTILGVSTFLLLFWEARSRYLFNITPFFILITTIGITKFYKICKTYFVKREL